MWPLVDDVELSGAMEGRTVMKLRIAALLAFMLTVAACGAGSPETTTGARTQNTPGEASAANSGWVEMPTAPLSPRRAAQAFEIEGRLLIMGGTEADPCPPNADCSTPEEAPFSDGAFFDPATSEWESIAEAPVPIGYSSGAVIGRSLFLRVYTYGSTHPDVQDAFMRYDASVDEWTRLELPPGDKSAVLTEADDKVIAFQTTQENGVRSDHSYDPATGRWSQLPPDPLTPSFDRWMVSTDAGVVLLGIENVPDPGSEQPSFYRAAVLREGRWERLPDSEVIGWDPEAWAWSGRYVVNASTESADGGEVNGWDRRYPAGGMLDPSTGEWTELPRPPADLRRTGFYSSSPRGMVRGTNQVFDAKEMSWVTMPELAEAPDGEMAQAWVGDTFFVWGGTRYEGNEGTLLGTGWMWTPDW